MVVVVGWLLSVGCCLLFVGCRLLSDVVFWNMLLVVHCLVFAD